MNTGVGKIIVSFGVGREKTGVLIDAPIFFCFFAFKNEKGKNLTAADVFAMDQPSASLFFMGKSTISNSIF